MKLSDFRYPLPRNLIARYPHTARRRAPVVVNRSEESITGMRFNEITQFFKKKLPRGQRDQSLSRPIVRPQRRPMRRSKSSSSVS
jgi:hypothetical protein